MALKGADEIFCMHTTMTSAATLLNSPYKFLIFSHCPAPSALFSNLTLGCF
jgi:hypothetical protein